ncbi:MAG TPA: NAD-dependent epimerase/dehydratase family protein, partial [Spirochaetota bacterium]|nr:NAD-dependent epimerase/dehydratase family protein [Spirochaetota bacterium]
MKILFIGGTGTISRAVSEKVIEEGHELYLLNRGNSDLPEGALSIKADINNIDEVSAKIKDMRFDCVADFIAFTPENVERDYNLFKDKTSQYIFISSASAYQKPVGNYLINEGTPLCNPYWEYSRNKIACEDVLLKLYREKNFPVTIVRPSYTYDERS